MDNFLVGIVISIKVRGDTMELGFIIGVKDHIHETNPFTKHR